MYQVGVLFLLLLASIASLFHGNLFNIFGILVFIALMSREVIQYSHAAYVQIWGAFTAKKRLKSYGQWAVITGCTRGIGLEFSRQLAEMGMDLVLVARNPKLLSDLALELRTMHGVQIVQIVADFSRNDKALYDEIKEKLRRLEGEIGILINNVGVFFEFPRYFHEVAEKDILDMINVNVVPALLLSHNVIQEHMLPRKKGLVVLIGSASSMKPNPLFNAYAASKGFIKDLSAALYEEYKNTGVYIQDIEPFYVATDMAIYSSPRPSLFSPSPQTYVKSAISAMGMTSVTSAYFPHTFQRFILLGLPDWFYLWAYRPRVEKFRAKYEEKLHKREAIVTNK